MPEPQELNWFREFVGELAAVPSSEAFYGGTIKSLLTRSRRIHTWTPRGAGWWVNVATLANGAMLQVWLDRYLDRGGDAHLGVWISTTKARALSMAGKLPEPARGPYTWDDRDDDGFLVSEVARQERKRIRRYFLDDWGRFYLGSYVRESPHLRPAADSVPSVIAALRVLVELAGPTERPGPRARGKTRRDDERYLETITRLARPEQAAFRAKLLAAHDARCVVTGCDAVLALEAAHIRPVGQGGGDGIENGLLLRADLHRLFDAGLITILVDEGAKHGLVAVAAAMAKTQYTGVAATAVNGLTAGQRRALQVRNRNWTRGGLVEA
ncbi:MAG: HNH endonuclease signature motif containing protein [Sandaracinus sp.]